MTPGVWFCGQFYKNLYIRPMARSVILFYNIVSVGKIEIDLHYIFIVPSLCPQALSSQIHLTHSCQAYFLKRLYHVTSLLNPSV